MKEGNQINQCVPDLTPEAPSLPPTLCSALSLCAQLLNCCLILALHISSHECSQEVPLTSHIESYLMIAAI